MYIDCRVEHRFVDYCENHVNVDEVINYLNWLMIALLMSMFY